MALSDTLLESALSLAARGFKVFPLEPGKKTPAHKGWQQLATTNPDTIRSLWKGRDYNVGVLTGHGVLVVDIDVKNGKQGAESFKALGLSREERDTFRVKTASGGFHVYYRWSGLDLGNSVGQLGAGLDTRALGGYVVGPASALTNGSGEGVYVIEHDADLADLPIQIRERLGHRRERPEQPATPAVDLDRMDAISRARSWLLGDAPLAVEGEGGDLTTFKVAAFLKDIGVSKGQAFVLLDELWNERCSPPWEFEELQEKVENAYRYGSTQPGAEHPAAVFRDVDPAALNAELPKSDSAWVRHGDAFNKNVRWLYHEALPALGVAVLIGPPQAGKTFVCIELARSLATAKPFFGLTPDARGGTVFLFAGSESSGLPLRLGVLGESGRLPISATTVADLSARGALGRVLTTVREEAARMKETFGVPLKMVCLETLSASGLLVNELDNSEIARALANLGTLSRELDCLVMTTHHPPKGGFGARGGGAIGGSADYILEITRDGNDSLRKLDITKARDAEQRQLGTFTLLKETLGEDDRGRPVTSMTVSMGEPIVRGGRRIGYVDVFMQAIDFAVIECDEKPEGHEAAEWDAVLSQFRDIKSGSKDAANVKAAFKRCFDYATDVGSVGSGVFNGARYLWRKEVT